MRTLPIFIFCAIALLTTGCLENAPDVNVKVTASASLDLESEKEAIRKVIAEETESYYRQDFDAWRNTYVDSSYFRSYGSWDGWPEKVRFYNGFDTLEAIKKLQFQEDRTIWKGSTETRHHENFRIFPEVAWYTFEQESFDGKTKALLGRSLETRILEKHDGQWKIAYLGFHYLPTEE